MRVVVDIPDAYTELVDELDAFTPRQRAARIRMLATMGVVALKGRTEASAGETLVQVPRHESVEKVEDAGQQEARSALQLRLMGSLGAT